MLRIVPAAYYFAMVRWRSKLAYPLDLRDGRTLTTLIDVHELLIELTPNLRTQDVWKRAAEKLIAAAEQNGSIESATYQVQLALITSRLWAPPVAGR